LTIKTAEIRSDLHAGTRYGRAAWLNLALPAGLSPLRSVKRFLLKLTLRQSG